MHIPNKLPNGGLEVSRFILQVNVKPKAEDYVPKYREFAMDIM